MISGWTICVTIWTTIGAGAKVERDIEVGRRTFPIRGVPFLVITDDGGAVRRTLLSGAQLVSAFRSMLDDAMNKESIFLRITWMVILYGLSVDDNRTFMPSTESGPFEECDCPDTNRLSKSPQGTVTLQHQCKPRIV
jgi:hypothetical protein